jgi:ketosteroid isomerase-like protein
VTSEAEHSIRQLYNSYYSKDLDSVAAFLPDGFQFRMNLPGGSIPGASQDLDRASSLELFRNLIDSYEFIAINVGPVMTDGQRAFVQPHIHYRHKLTGEHIETTLMHVWTLAEGKPVRLEEFHDVDRTLSHLARIAAAA